LKKLIACLVMLGTLAMPAVVNAEGVKIAFVNGTRLVEESPQAQAAAERIKKEFDPRQQDILTAQQQLRDREERFLKDNAFMSAAEKQNKERGIVSAQRELRLKETELREDFTIRRNQEMAKVWDVLREAIQSYGKDQGFDLILFEGVSYASPEVDVTEDILKHLKK
jgi:outer membrane protein